MPKYQHWFAENDKPQVKMTAPIRAHRYRHGSFDATPIQLPLNWESVIRDSPIRWAVLGVDTIPIDPDPEADWYDFSLERLHVLSTILKRPPRDLSCSYPRARTYDGVIIGQGLRQAYPGLEDIAVRALKFGGVLWSTTPLDHEELVQGCHQNGWYRYMRSRIKLLIAAPALVIGGADRALVDLIQGLHALKYEIFLVTTETTANTWIGHVLPFVTEFWDMGSMTDDGLLRITMLQDLVNRKAPDLFYVMHSRTGYDVIPWIKAHTGAKILAQYHLEEPGGGWIGYSQRLYGNLIDRSIVITEHLKRRLSTGYYVAPNRISVIYLGVEKPSVQPQVRSHPKRLKVLYPARLEPQKAPWRLLDIAENLRRNQVPATIHVVGDGTLTSRLQTELSQRRLQDYLKLEGRVQADAMTHQYQSSDAVLLTSDYEGLPLAILEGMSHGLPVIAPNVGAVNEVLDDMVGYLIPDPEDIAAYVTALTALAADPDLCRILGQRGQQRIADRFDPNQMIAHYHAVFLDVLNYHQQLVDCNGTSVQQESPQGSGYNS